MQKQIIKQSKLSSYNNTQESKDFHQNSKEKLIKQKDKINQIQHQINQFKQEKKQYEDISVQKMIQNATKKSQVASTYLKGASQEKKKQFYRQQQSQNTQKKPQNTARFMTNAVSDPYSRQKAYQNKQNSQNTIQSVQFMPLIQLKQSVQYKRDTNKQKFTSIEPKVLKVQNRETIDKSPLQIKVRQNPLTQEKKRPKIQKQKVRQGQKDSKVERYKNQQQKKIQSEKEKVKKIYDKIRKVGNEQQQQQSQYQVNKLTGNIYQRKLNQVPLQKVEVKEEKIQSPQPPKIQIKLSKKEQQQLRLKRYGGNVNVEKVQSFQDIQQRISGKSKAQQILSGKLSIIWLFAIKSKLPSLIIDRIFAMYNPLLDQDKIVPYCQNPRKIRDYLNIPNCLFKIVTDLQNAQEALFNRIRTQVVQFYIYNEKGNNGIAQALEFKNVTKKVKGIFTDWNKLLNRAQEQIDEQIMIYKVNNGFQKREKQKKFPNFLKLTSTDKTQATLYRINLYGAIKLQEQQKKIFYQDFMKLVIGKYGTKTQEQDNISDYEEINHNKLIKNTIQAQPIIKFYVRQSFYYQVLNSMLRTMKTTQEFKPCVLPFNETYQSIKLYYEVMLCQMKNVVPEMILYRGCRLKKRDFNQLKTGIFIQMFGFMSTSKSQSRAQQFVDRDGYMFVIHVKRRQMKQKYKNFDHGFVDINKYNLAGVTYSQQQQVLFNALNVYQVGTIQQKDGYTYIHLYYGVIFDLLDKPKQQLLPDQYDTLINYHYCTKVLGKIQDHGDVFLFASQYENAKEYYNGKIKEGKNQALNLYKLSNVQKECGQIDQAEKNAQRSLELYQEKINIDDREMCLKVFGIHAGNAQINIQKEDYLTADQDIDRALEMLTDEDIFEKGVKLRQRGQIKFKKGQIINSQRDFQQSQKIFQSIRSQAKRKRWEVTKNYYISHLGLICSSSTRQVLKENRQMELKKIEELQKKISQLNEDIEDQLVKVNKSLKDVSLYVNDRDKYQQCVKKARGYLIQLQARKANDPDIKAKLLATQAMIQDYEELAKSEALLNQAILLIQNKNPFDEKVADYSKFLAKLQKKELQKFLNPGGNKLMNEKPQTQIGYNFQQRKKLYQNCKKNYHKTINILLYNERTNKSPEVLQLKNQLGELSFNQSDYEECEKMIKDLQKGNDDLVHTEMAKALILMARIAYARGELKNSLQILEKAQIALEESMVKKHQKQNQKKVEKYRKIFQNSDSYITIRFVRITVFQKQKQHDLALKSINILETDILKKMDGYDSHPLLCELYEIKGGVQVFCGNSQNFDQFFQKALKLRQKQFGYYHTSNAKCYCSYAKFLLLVKDFKNAVIMIEKALQIISSYQESNPQYWTMFYSQGMLKQKLQDFQQADRFYDKSLKWATKHFNRSHIAIKQIKLKYANTLSKSRKYAESLSIYKELQQQLDEGIRQSVSRSKVEQQKDDQKISLKKLMYTQLSQTSLQQPPMSDSYLMIQRPSSQIINRTLYSGKLNQLRQTYHIRSNKKQADKN